MGDEHICRYEERWGEVNEYHKGVNQKLDSILTQTLLTNGRLRKLETFRLVVTAVFSAIILTVAFMLIAHQQGWVEAIIQYGGS
jgi:hypothetical protein